ncbi:MAG TPA: 50S ribosomal protein L18 [Gemmatimonadales bacterium]|nr:50S ribosomal protein L18 [Gemmatimonadales bacterium]
MRSLYRLRTQDDHRRLRHLRVRKKISGTPERPRLVVFRSSKHMYAQLVDDVRGVTLVGGSDRSEGIATDGKGKTGKSFNLGRLVAERAKAKGITKVVFDRAGYRYHGRVKAVADGARKGGLEF